MHGKYPLKISDIEFVAFRQGRGPGGQFRNKVATSIRATHVPTGIRVESVKERSQSANKEAAIRTLQEKLDRLSEERKAEARREAYDAKPEAGYGSQVRTYRMCGNVQGVTDHRSGVTHPNARGVLDGDLDRFLGVSGAGGGQAV